MNQHDKCAQKIPEEPKTLDDVVYAVGSFGFGPSRRPFERLRARADRPP